MTTTNTNKDTMTSPGGSQLPTERLLNMFHTMCVIREFETKVDDLFAHGLVHGTVHLSIGQEACAVGAIAALRPDDLILSNHRGHGHCIAKGADLNLMMAEFLGKESGYCRGRGGSMHIADVEGGNLGANGVVGGGVPLATGVGLGLHIKGTDQVVLSFFGDGATNQGAFHEAVNMAAIWQLPVVFICENNQYGMSMSWRLSTHLDRLSDRAAAYGIPGTTLDGNDVLAVWEGVTAAVDRARRGAGPSFVELLTYRWKGHSKSDRNLYRTREEIESWKAQCPILRFRTWLLSTGTATEKQLDDLQMAAAAEIVAALEFATASPEPDPNTVLEGVYAEE